MFFKKIQMWPEIAEKNHSIKGIRHNTYRKVAAKHCP
jgi:hypothetical protein